MGKTRKKNQDIKVVDLFCGVGGLTHGLVLEGFDVTAGVDNDETCRYAFETNNKAAFINKNIAEFGATELNNLFGNAKIKVLVGCAPCQPFSALNRQKVTHRATHERWQPLVHFMELIAKTKPDIVSMENVPDLADEKKYPIFFQFTNSLIANGYKVSYRVVDISRYGVPQKRRRLVLLASKHGEIALIPETHTSDNLVTVRDAIGQLRPIKDGECDPKDPLHRASKLSELNRKRIRATPKDGGSATSWDRSLLPKCYRRKSGKSFMVTVYGRMKWNSPSPTMTTQCVTLGTGRYGHPTQNRAISLREAALFQSFPKNYQFERPENIAMNLTAKHIGNAVPVLLGRAIGKSIKKHLEGVA
jgi:DNA (cytosine-5)-methyltransferase 1